jgi:DNA-binding transcriptional MerR regulator
MRRAGGRRLYRPQDIELLRGIRQLLHEQGFTTKGVQKILKQKGSDYVAAVGRGAPPVLGRQPANLLGALEAMRGDVRDLARLLRHTS